MVWVANGSAARERRSRSSSDGNGKASARRRRRRGANLLSRGRGGAPEACAVSRESDAVARARATQWLERPSRMRLVRATQLPALPVAKLGKVSPSITCLFID